MMPVTPAVIAACRYAIMLVAAAYFFSPLLPLFRRHAALLFDFAIHATAIDISLLRCY